MTLTRLARLPGVRHLRAWAAKQRIADAEAEYLGRAGGGWPEEMDLDLPERIRKGEA